MKEKQLYLFGFHRDSADNNEQYKVILPLDMLIFLGVSVIILLVLSFFLGTERGKKIAARPTGLEEPAAAAAAQAQAESAQESADDSAQEDVSGAQEPVAETAKEENAEKYYIQVASFQKENSAFQEADKLEKDGCPILTVKRGSYTVVYVGGFTDKEEAKNKLTELKKKYKDCILRRL